jgi:hypothetical protein
VTPSGDGLHFRALLSPEIVLPLFTTAETYVSSIHPPPPTREPQKAENALNERPGWVLGFEKRKTKDEVSQAAFRLPVIL